jgi:hypothetical protein
MPNSSFKDANAFHRMMRTLTATKVGAALLRPTANRLDQLITKATGGRRSFARVATGIPTVILTTTGAKSGQPRTVAVYGIPHPDGLALIASNWGAQSTLPGTTISRPTQKPRYLSRAIRGRPPPDPPHPASATRSGLKA